MTRPDCWIRLFHAVVSVFLIASQASSFAPLPSTTTRRSFGIMRMATQTVEAPTREDTTTDITRSPYDDDDDYSDMEYLIDQEVSRELEDPFHILLLGSTFDKPKITVTYVSGSLEYVLSMPVDEAKELSNFAKLQGMSCLGTWTREECLSLGRQLQRRDLVCRVVPYTQGGQRGWQAKDAEGQQIGFRITE